MEIILIVVVAVLVIAVVGFVVVRRPETPDTEAGRGRATPVASAPTAEVEEDEATGGVAVVPEAAPEILEEAPPELVEPPVEVRPTFRERLGKARTAFSGAVGSVLGRSGIDQASWDDLEEALLQADVGIGPTQELLDAVREVVVAEGLHTPVELIEATKAEMKRRLVGDIELVRSSEPPTIWLFVGVNGVGKTTTIGKVGRRLSGEGETVVMAAGDTFRAAAAEQLATWAERCGAELVKGSEGADPSSVVFDAVDHAAASGAGVVLADTAGRLHTKSNLMDELTKVRRVADKGAGSVTEVLLVLDATTGQNGLVQARQFRDAVELTGVVLTKLDGSAKGGIVLAIAAELGIPVKLVGLGEGAADLVPFDADDFVEALFATG